MSALSKLLEELQMRAPDGEALKYHVPALWLAPGQTSPINPYHFLADHVERILASPQPAPPPPSHGAWVEKARIYNMFVRLTTAWDHDQDGHLGSPRGADRESKTCNSQGVRETGTFLKAIALLDHVRRLGCNTIHLLPITAVGSFGNKGALGSPYAIQNPYRIEPTLADPLIKSSVDDQLAAFVEACHRLGMRVILEFVFRTSSRDGDWVAEHPDWYYWIRREVEDRPPGAAQDDPRYYGLPPFDETSLKIMKAKVAEDDFTDLPPPPQWYRELFSAPPHDVRKDADGRWIGTSPEGHTVHVPSAFADWPPDDPQPPWTDVTYLKVYDDPEFNYIAYNTIRMYDTRLAQPEKALRPLWDAVRGIVPHFQQTVGIDGVMVDMGHALPHELMEEIIQAARDGHPDFALLSENFVISEESVTTGYNAVLGYQFRAVETAGEMRRLITRTCIEGLPLSCFGTAETHNTPRVAMRDRGPVFCRTVWLANNFMPYTIPFIHNGFELGETEPVNLGLAFTKDELKALGGKPLALFDARALSWDRAGDLPEQLAHIAQLRHKYLDVAESTGETHFAWLDAGHDDVLAFARGAAPRRLLLVLNWDTAQPRSFDVDATDWPGVAHFDDPLDGATYNVLGGRLKGLLPQGGGLLLVPRP